MKLNNPTEVFAIGDIHGEYHLFQEMLQNYQTQQQLILIGDLNDRGKKSKDCWLLGKKLVEEQNVIYLMGNHEAYFLEFLAAPEDWGPNYFHNGGKETMESLLHPGAIEEYSPTEMAMMIKSRYGELITFLQERPFYFEWEKYIFVHAGVDLVQKDWKKSSPHDFLWIREPFIKGKNQTGKTIVFGHTVTPMLYGDMTTTDLWQSDGKIGIDGGAVFGGSLHGVVFNQEKIVKDFEISNAGHGWQPSI
ncbi:metallophosphoesterase family protein [Enterococcus sp. AZ103]|uniref:metallophosphoesterase family protein n=1 Tax=Enterococcus sp. AZ103 TaxID=2774628 RepID=UPI003F206AC8